MLLLDFTAFYISLICSGDPQERYEIESDENRMEVAQTIYRTYLDREVSFHICKGISKTRITCFSVLVCYKTLFHGCFGWLVRVEV